MVDVPLDELWISKALEKRGDNLCGLSKVFALIKPVNSFTPLIIIRFQLKNSLLLSLGFKMNNEY